MAIDLKTFRDKNAHWYEDDDLATVAKDVYDRGSDKIRKGFQTYDEWKQRTGIQQQIDEDNKGRAEAVDKARIQAELADRGVLGDLASDVARGVVGAGMGTLQTMHGALTAARQEDTGIARTLQSGIEGIEDLERKHSILQDQPDRGFFGRAIHGGIESAVQSEARKLPGTVGGAAAGFALGGPAGAFVGGVLGRSLAGGVGYGLSQYDDVMTRGMAKAAREGLTPGEARERYEPTAVREGVYEGGFEFLGDLLEGATMGAGKLVTAPGKQAAKVAVKDLFNESWKKIGKRMLGTAGIEAGSEMLTAGAQAEEEHAVGLGDQRFWAAATDAFGPSFVAGLIFGGYGHAAKKYTQGKIRKTLENPNADPEQRAAIAQEIYAGLQEYDPLVADVWGQSAFHAIQNKQTISTDDNVLELQDRIQTLRQDPDPKARKEAEALQKKMEKLFTTEHEKPLPTEKDDLELERQYYEGLSRVLSTDQEAARRSVEERIGQLDQALDAEDAYEIRRENLGRQGFQMPPQDRPYSPELAERIQQDAVVLGLPAPSRDFEMRRPENVYSPYSPEMAEKVTAGPQQLPPGQGFEMRGAPEDVASRYSPEMAEAVKKPKLGLPRGQGFELKQGESARRKIEQFDTRIKNLSAHANQIAKQISKVDKPEKREKLQSRLKAIQEQIDQNRTQRQALEEAAGAEAAEPAPTKSASESAGVFEKDTGRVQSPVGKELLQQRLTKESKVGVQRAPIPPRHVNSPDSVPLTPDSRQVSSGVIPDATPAHKLQPGKTDREQEEIYQGMRNQFQDVPTEDLIALQKKNKILPQQLRGQAKALRARGAKPEVARAQKLEADAQVAERDNALLQRLIEERSGKTPAPAAAGHVPGKTFTERMKSASTAEDGRRLIREYEEDFAGIEKAAGLPPSVGKGGSGYADRGYSTLTKQEKKNALRRVTKASPELGNRLRELMQDIDESVPHWETLHRKEMESYWQGFEEPDRKEVPGKSEGQGGLPGEVGVGGKPPRAPKESRAGGKAARASRAFQAREKEANTPSGLTPGQRYDLEMKPQGARKVTKVKNLTFEKVEGKTYWFKGPKGNPELFTADAISNVRPTGKNAESAERTDEEIALGVQPERFTTDERVIAPALAWDVKTKRKYLTALEGSDLAAARKMDGFGGDKKAEDRRGTLADIIGQQLQYIDDVRSGAEEKYLQKYFEELGRKEPGKKEPSRYPRKEKEAGGPDKAEAAKPDVKGQQAAAKTLPAREKEPKSTLSLRPEATELRHVVLKAFPGASVLSEDGQRIRFKMPSGSEILLNHGTATLENGAEGAWTSVGLDGVMWLAKDLDQEVVHHEAFEAAFDLALTDKERKILIEKYGSAHEAAAAYQKWDPKASPDTLFQKILEFFRKIRQALFPTVESTFESVRSGKAWARAAAGAGLERLSDVELAEVDPQVLNLFGLIREGRKTYTEWEGKRLSEADAKKKINQSFVSQARELGYTEEQARKVFQGFSKINTILNGLDQGLFEEGDLESPIRSNADYIKTVDLNTTCPKRFKYAATIDVIQKKLGRPLTQGETVRIAKMLKDRGEEYPCLYCYVESGRGAYNSALLKYIKEKDKTLNPRVFVDAGFEAKETKKRGMADRIKKARGYAQAASMSNQPKVYAEYRGQILTMKQDLKDEINKRAGLRFFSNTDFQAEHILDLMQIAADMKIAGLMGHAYTKVPDFVRVFGKAGIKINMSVYGSVKNGKFVPDDTQGMPWKEAVQLRKEFPNAGTILVATDPETLEWALASDDIDMIIPWHRSGMGKETTEKGWLDFSRHQQESWIDPESAPLDKTGKRVKAPHVYERYSGLDHNGPGHNNSKEKYLELAKALGVNPKFPNHVDHPGYMKLIRDYARVEQPQEVVDPAGIDVEKAKELIAAWAEKGGEERTPVQPVVDAFLAAEGKTKLSIKKEGAPAAREQKAIAPEEQIHRQIEARMREISSGWKGVEVETVQTFTDLPADVASGVMQALMPENASDAELEKIFHKILTRTEGFYNPKNKKAYLISRNLRTPYRAEEVLLHEVVGHHGMRELLGERYNHFLREVVARYGKEGLQDIARLYGFDLNTAEGRMRAADEKIARMAEANERPGFLKRLYAAVREALRKLGFKIELSESDIKALLVASRKALGNAKGTVGIREEGSLFSKRELIGDEGFNLENFDGRVSQYTRSREIAEATAEALNRAFPDSEAKVLEPYPGLYEVNWKNTAPSAARIPHNPAAYRKGRMTDAQKRALGVETWDMAAEWTRKSFEEGKPETFLSLSATEALDRLQTRLQGTPKAEVEILFGKSADLRELRDSFRIPAWLAKSNQTVRKFFDRQNERDKERSSLYHGFLESTQDAFNLVGAEQDEFGKLAFRLEHKKVVEEPTYIKTGERALVKGPENEVVMVPVYELNPEHYKALDAYLEGEKVSEGVRKAYVAVRKALDTTWVMALDRLMEIRNIDPVLIQKYRTEMGRIRNYFPHNRYGNHFIRAVDPKAKPGEETRYRQHFNALNDRHARFWYARNIDSIVEGLKKTHPDVSWGEMRWEVGKNRELPEEVYDFPIPIDAMQQIVDAAVDNMPEEEALKQTLRRELSREISDTLKSRGFGSHMIERKDIPGHETQDPLRVIHDHFAGFAGWLTKMNAAYDFGNMLRELDAKEKPNEYKWATKFVNDMLMNATQLDRFVDGARTFFFLKYLGLNVKTAAVNLTQNIIAGIPRLSMDVGVVKASKEYLKAANDLKAAITQKALAKAGKGRFTDEERTFLTEMFHEGWGQAQLVTEMRGKVGGPFRRQLAKAARVMGFPMELAERFNRMSLGLAAFRAARAGMITSKKTLREFKLKPRVKAPVEVAKRFAETVVNDSHFIYGKGNRPGFLRGTAAGKVLSTSYTFRSFSHNLLSMWRWMLVNGDREGKKAFAYSLMAMTMLGGIGSLPLYGGLAALIRQVFGEDVLGLGVRKALPKGMRDPVMYGAPSILGVDIAGSIGMELPMVDRMRVNQSLKGQIGTAIGELLGIPFAVLEDFTGAVDALRSGRPDRALEMASPTFMKNILSSVRLKTEGQTTLSGRPVNLPGEKGPRRIGAGEAIAKSFGFQPVGSSKAWDVHRSLEEIKSYRDQKQEELANRYIAAMRKKDNREMVQIREEARIWNRRAVIEGRGEMKIDLDRAVKARKSGRQPMKQMRGVAREYRETFGM